MKKTTFAILSALLIAMTSCNKEAELLYTNQEAKIDTYINGLLGRNEEAEVIRNNGSNRVITKHGEGEALVPGGTISFYIAGYTFSGSFSNNNLFFTNSETAATAASWNLSEVDFNVKTMTLNKEEFIEGLYNGLIGVKGGEECEIIFSGKYGYGKKKNGTIPANSALLYKVWVESISNN